MGFTEPTRNRNVAVAVLRFEAACLTSELNSCVSFFSPPFSPRPRPPFAQDAQLGRAAVLSRRRDGRGSAQGKSSPPAPGRFTKTDWSIGHRGAPLQFPRAHEGKLRGGRPSWARASWSAT